MVFVGRVALSCVDLERVRQGMTSNFFKFLSLGQFCEKILEEYKYLHCTGNTKYKTLDSLGSVFLRSKWPPIMKIIMIYDLYLVPNHLLTDILKDPAKDSTV